jgi:hypothetical protein
VLPGLRGGRPARPHEMLCRSKTSLEISMKIKATIEVEFEMDREIRPPASRGLQINFEYPSLNYQFYGAFD